MSDNGEAEAEALALAFDDQKGEMLEDEEMPTFISVSSTGKDISIPYGADGNVELMPIENADQVDNENRDNADQATANDYEAHSTTRSPTSEEQNEEGSVYVVSSGEDNDPSSNSDDDEVDDEDDIDDDDDDDIDGEIIQISHFADSGVYHLHFIFRSINLIHLNSTPTRLSRNSTT